MNSSLSKRLLKSSYSPGILLLFLLPVYSLAQLPGTDIWLMKINETDGIIRLIDPQKITSKNGYQNQPSFSKDGASIYFTSQCDTCAKTSIQQYSLAAKSSRQVSNTAMSPYSAMPSLLGNALSIVMVETDSTQRLWQYPLDGTPPFPLFPKRDSIGYYAWINEHAIVAYILGNLPPNSRLSLISDNRSEKTLATNIGRGMKSFGKGVLFIQQLDSTKYLSWTDFFKSTKLLPTPGGSEDLAIYKNYVLMGSGGVVFAATINSDKQGLKEVKEFKPLQDLSSFGIKHITRIAISRDEKWIALVDDGN